MADVRGFRFSASSFSNRSRILSASRHAFGPGGTTSIRLWRFFVTGSTPAYTRTRRAPLGSSFDVASRTGLAGPRTSRHW